MTICAAELPNVRIQILQVPGCPLVDGVIQLARECQAHVGDSGPLVVSIGQYPSPTLLVDGRDVTTGEPVAGEARCRLDLPTGEQVLSALARNGWTDSYDCSLVSPW